MLWRSSTLIGSGIHAKDGSIGSVADLLFQDTDWAIRWVVVDTGSWLTGRKVLLPPVALGRPANLPQEFPVDLTRQQVEDSPGIETDAPVSRQFEARMHAYYGQLPHWPSGYIPLAGGATGAIPTMYTGGVPPTAAPVPPADDLAEPSGDPSLRSARKVTGYYVRARDDDIGHVEEFLVDDEGWTIRYVLVDTRNWWPGRKVLVAPNWVREVNWSERQVHVDLTRDEVERSPEYDPSRAVDRAYEERLYAHYGRQPGRR